MEPLRLSQAVAKTLANELCCRSIFSTHYHTLMGDFNAGVCVVVVAWAS